jgi:hypothetical protein
MLRQLVRGKRTVASAALQEDKTQGRIDVHQLVLARVGP